MSKQLYEVPQCEELIIFVENVILYGADNGNAKAPNGVSGGYYGDEF